MEKFYPQVGEHLYLRQRTGSYYVDLVKTPYTVIAVSPKNVTIQACKMTPPVYHCVGNPDLDRPDLEGQRVWFYDTVAEKIEEDSEGNIINLTWAPKKGQWQYKQYPGDSYPEFAVFGKWEHTPYLD